MREQPLFVFWLDIGNGFEELPQQVVMPPLNRVLGIRAVARPLLVSEQFRVTLVGGELLLCSTRALKLDGSSGILMALGGRLVSRCEDEKHT